MDEKDHLPCWVSQTDGQFLMLFLPLFIAEQCRSSILCMAGHCCQGIFIQMGVGAAMHVCLYLQYSSCKHVQWGKTRTASEISLWESQEKVQFLVNH